MKNTLDLIVPAYNEEEVLELFLRETTKVLRTINDYECKIILVNDGSKDKTLELAKGFQKSFPELSIVNLSRNFGHEQALAAGLSVSKAEAVIVMDADLQDPPALIPEMLKTFEEGFDVVNARRAARKTDSIFKKATAAMFYKFINMITEKVKVPENVGNYRLISARVRESLNNLPERDRVFRILVPYMGYKTATIDFERPPRPAGETHYNYSAMTRLAADGITAATTMPLKLAVKAGLLISFGGFVYLCIILWQALVLKDTVAGWASTMVVMLFIGGIQLLFLGILGQYLGHIFNQVKGRPNFVIQEYLENKED